MATTKKTILIICEGEKTEPLFFNSIRDAVKDHVYNIGEVEINIKPEPIIDETDTKDEANPHKPKRKARHTKAASVGAEPVEIKAPLPLKWVLEAQKELEDGTCNEAWAVFDHDDHHARREAFEEAEKVVNGTTVKIAFSSRSFEFYLLMHFERIFKHFETSECRDKNNIDSNKRKKIIECSTDKHNDDCHGQKCIGGYARSKGYWVSSKKSISTFELIKEKLEIGFENSAWLRYASEILDSDKDIFDRNPYITVDSIVKRLTGYENIKWLWLNLNSPYIFNDIEIVIDSNKKVSVKNNGSKRFFQKTNSFLEIKSDNSRTAFGQYILLNPGEMEEFIINGESNSWFLLHLDDNHNLMFSFNNDIILLKMCRMLYSLSHKELSEVLSILRSKINC